MKIVQIVLVFVIVISLGLLGYWYVNKPSGDAVMPTGDEAGDFPLMDDIDGPTISDEATPGIDGLVESDGPLDETNEVFPPIETAVEEELEAELDKLDFSGNEDLADLNTIQ